MQKKNSIHQYVGTLPSDHPSNEPAGCPFCSLPENRILFTSQSALAIRDAFPISPGHTLVIPNRHVKSIFELENAERNDLFQALSRARSHLVSEMKPDGFNVGINDGLMAGQTVMHLHVHLIPRFEGDKEDPRGGIRWIFPEKAKYWP